MNIPLSTFDSSSQALGGSSRAQRRAERARAARDGVVPTNFVPFKVPAAAPVSVPASIRGPLSVTSDADSTQFVPFQVPAPAPVSQRGSSSASSDLEAADNVTAGASWKKTLLYTGGAILALAAIVAIGVGVHAHQSQHKGAAGVTTGATSPNATQPPVVVAPPVAPKGPAPWLYIEGNQFYQAAGNFSGFGVPATKTPFLGRGANLQDTRDCRLCKTDIPVSEVLRRIDALAAVPGVNMMRLTLEADNATQTLTADSTHAANVKTIIDYAGTKPNFYVHASIWIDPSLTPEGRPSNATHLQLQKLVSLTGNASHVLFGVANEPQNNYSGVNNTLVFTAMNQAVDAIRQAESAINVPPHIVTVQGTKGWAADVSFYETSPITAGNGRQVAYEIHEYYNSTYFADRITKPARLLPMLIGEFGPPANQDPAQMHVSDVSSLMTLARQLNIPHMAWTFNPRCGPSLLDDYTPANACLAPGGPLTMNNPFGQAFLAGMAANWTANG